MFVDLCYRIVMSINETTISANLSDNDFPQATMTPPTSDGGAQERATEETTTSTTTPRQGMEQQLETQAEQPHKGISLLARLPKLKREKSYSETLERKKKKVKFSTSDADDDVIVDTRVFDPHMVPICPADGGDEGLEDRAIHSPLKKLLRKRSKKRKSTIETQTEDDVETAWREKGNGDSKVRKNGNHGGNSVCAGEGSHSEETLPPRPSESGPNGGETGRGAQEHAPSGRPSTADVPEHCLAEASTEFTSLTRPEPGEEKGANCDAVASTVPYPAANEECESVLAFSKSEECVCAHERHPNPLVPDESCEYENKRLLRDSQSPLPPCQPAEGNVRPGSDALGECRPRQTTIELSISSEADSLPQRGEYVLDGTESSPGTPEAQDPSDNTSQVTVKREGTFTLDGPPPAKITKSANDAAGEDATPIGCEIVEPLQFFIPLVTSESKSDNANSGKPVRKNSPACLSKTKENRAAKVPEAKIKTRLQDQSSTVTVIKSNARRTLANVWKNTLKPQESQSKSTKPTPKPAPKVPPVAQTSMKRQQDDKITRISLLRKREATKPQAVKEKQVTSIPSKESQERQRLSRSPTKKPTRQDYLRKSGEKSSVWASVSLPTFRRDGTFTKKYDSERDRLQAECSKLGIEKDRLQSELNEARRRLEDEVAAKKALKRTHELNLRQLREAELRRTEVLLADMKNRLEDEKRETLLQQRDTLSRSHECELLRAEREREESHRRALQEARHAQERLKAEMRREATRSDPPAAPCCRCTDRDLERLNRELSTLREHKKRLEEAVQTLQESERQRSGELRRLHDEHEVAIAKIHRANKSEGARLLDELRSKERTIGLLERQVSAQASKIRLQEEKLQQQREGSSDRADDAARKQTTRGGAGSGASGKRQKDAAAAARDGGKARDKEPCTGSSTTNTSSRSSSLNSVIISSATTSSLPIIALRLEAVDEANMTVSHDHHHHDHDHDHDHDPPAHAPAMPVPAATKPTSDADQQEQPTDPPHQPSDTLLAQMEQLKQDLEYQKSQNEEQLQQMAQQQQAFEEEKQRLCEEYEKRREECESDKKVLEEEIGAKTQQVEEQQRVMEAQKQVMEEQKQVMEEQKMMMEEQQVRIVDLETEYLVPPPLPPSWHARRESCVKVSELPTVMEQTSDDECSSTSSSPTETTPPHQPFPLDDTPTPAPTHTPMPVPEALSAHDTNASDEMNWPEIPAEEMAAQYALLSREHQGLQKSYQLLASTAAHTSSTPEYQGREGAAALWLSAKVLELEAEAATLREELQDTKDHADLLEFRCLELTEGADKSSEFGSTVETRDQSTSTEADEVTTPTGTSEDLSLPLSIDSGLDLSSDYKKARVSEARTWLAQLSRAAGEAEASAALQLAALLDWVATLPLQPHHGLSSPVSPSLPTPPSPARAGMGVEELGCDVGRDLMVLATRLQESLADPAAQEAVLLDTITKLRVLDSSLCQLQDRVVTLTDENRELQEAVASLSEAQETRTEASGTESELVHRKTPSIHSDLSDAELSDSPEHVQARPGKMVLDAATSFQESGIFDTSCELVHVTTQTDLSQIEPAFDAQTGPHKEECELQKEDVDLQSAVARLAAIRSAVQGRDLRHLRLQDLQESDEYLMRAALDEQRVTLSKVEYDSFVESERRLRQELEHIKCDKQQLALECESLKNKIRTQNSSRGTDAEEALKGEIRVLQQRLTMSERARREVFEEKCELEEEENDSRLMVQRLESQMEAAREMENLLSASLSQEQEISRELQRRVRDLQILEKEHRARFEKLDAMKCKIEDRAASLSSAREALAAQLTFVMYGLLAVDEWRRWAARPLTLVPCFGKQMEWEVTKTSISVNECVSVCSPVVLESCIQVPHSGLLMQQVHGATNQKYLSEEHGQRRPAEVNEEEPQNKRQKSIKTRTQATMTVKCESVTEREAFYLEQIEHLQREKISLRKGHDSERRNSIQQHRDLEGEIQEVRQQLQESDHDKCKLLFRLEEAQEKNEEMKNSYLQRIEELKSDMSRYKDLYELEKKALVNDHKAKLLESERERECLKERIHQLELQISTFRQELEIVGTSVAHDIVEMDTEMENIISHGSKSSMKKAHDGDVLEKIRELVKSETNLRQRIYDLEKKECAYRETIREADKIMSSHVTSYKQQIEDLEARASQQAAKIQQMEASEERLRTTMRNNSRTSDGARISDLLDRLIETENSELKLKERVWNLEKKEKELQIKLMEGERSNQGLRSELRDQEELVHRMITLESDNNALSAELSQAQDSVRKVSEMQQNESYLRGRVEELEVTESMLRETLHQADQILAQRERKLRDQVGSLQEEVQSYKAQLEAAVAKEHCARESELSYRKQLEELRTRLAETERDLLESSSETISHETQHRSEVTKLRNQLKLCNSQLLELDRLNCELRDQVLAAELEGQRLAKDLEDHDRRHEQDLLNFNLQVSSRDSRLEDLEHQLEQMRHDNAASELDALAAMPIGALHSSITALTTAVKNCKSCGAAQSETLIDVTGQLKTLAELLEGEASSPDMDDASETEEEDISDTAENLANEATTTPPPDPAKEGSWEEFSGDTASKRLRRSARWRSRRRPEDCNSQRRIGPLGSTTILEELEEKVKELEEAVSRKEEELRLADVEACDTNSQLEAKDAALEQKIQEIEHLNITLASLRLQLVATLEDAEKARTLLEATHKLKLEELKIKVEEITRKAEHLAGRCQLKDSIIFTLASQIRAILRSGNMGVIINQLHRLSEVTQKEEPGSKSVQEKDMPTVSDFDVEAVCSFLTQSEMAPLTHSTISNGVEPSGAVTLQPDTLIAPSHSKLEHTNHVTPQGTPSLAQQRKSRIPRFMPSVSNGKCAQPAATLTTQSFSVPMQKAALPVQKSKPISQPETLIKTKSDVEHAVKTVSQPLEGAKFAPVVKQEIKLTSSNATSIIKPMATSTPAKPTGRKVPTRQERSRFLSDARKIKRMVTGMVPLDAAVSCTAAPEWREQSPLRGSSAEVEATCVPRPHNLHITRRAGVDGVVIAWDPLEHDCVGGFQILVGGRVVQHVRSPHRTKALVSGLPLAGSFTIGLVAVADDGRCSTPAVVTQDRSRLYPNRNIVGHTMRRVIPTSL